jgi:hypothetical protein
MAQPDRLEWFQERTTNGTFGQPAAYSSKWWTLLTIEKDMRAVELSLSFLIPCLAFCGMAKGEVTRCQITHREPFAEGKSMGERGPYERWRGTVHFSLDPMLDANQAIVDLELAPRNAQGRVEFSADIEMLVPVDRSRANGTLFYEVNNRGNPTAPRIIDGDADHFLLRQGFVFVSSGWIAEVLPGNGRLTMTAPEARFAEQPLRGIVRSEVVVDRPVPRASIAHRANIGSYRPAQKSFSDATLAARQRELDPRQIVPRDQWRLVVSEVVADGRTGQLPLIELEVEGGLKPGWIYELIYEAEGAIVQGVGMAGIRDLVACLKYDTSQTNPLRRDDGSPLAVRAIGFGTSQSGRLLRQFVYEGFNADEQGRQVFDGVIPHVAGGGLGSFNHRFASPTRTNGQHDEHLFPADYFPFTYGDEKDPFTHRTDGILRRSRGSGTTPKVMHTQSSSEYWHRSGSLVHTDPQAQSDSEIPPEVRIYTFGGTQHGPGSGLPAAKAGGQNPANPADYRPLLRALVVAMDEWIRDGRLPPASVFPRISDHTLVGWRQQESGWPAIPGITYPEVIQQPPFLDRGPDWPTRRIATLELPHIKGSYLVKVPAHGPDGNERGTLMLPAVAVPVATYASWNLRDAPIGAAGELLNLQGSYLPFARTRSERLSVGDPRPALLERYNDYDDYQRQYVAAAQKLLAGRYLLAEDLPRLLALCEKHRHLFSASVK